MDEVEGDVIEILPMEEYDSQKVCKEYFLNCVEIVKPPLRVARVLGHPVMDM